MLPDLRDGSGDYDLPEAAAHIQRNAYTPYGSQRALNTDTSDDSPDVTFDASLSIERGWLSQVADEATSSLGTGLTYLNARYYDPVASRFISPDPLLDVMDPKTLDPYRYANNNPISSSDPSGLCTQSSFGTTPYCGSGSPSPHIKTTYTTPYYSSVPPKKATGSTPPSGSPELPGSNESEGDFATRYSLDKMDEWMQSLDANVVKLNGEWNAAFTDAFMVLGVKCKQGDTKACEAAGLMALISPVQAGSAAEAILILGQNFPQDAVWDMKLYLRESLNLDQRKPEDGVYWLDMGDGTQVRYDLFGNVQFGLMMREFGFSEDAAVWASLNDGSSTADTVDNSAISYGYYMGGIRDDWSYNDVQDFLAQTWVQDTLENDGWIRRN